MLDTALVYTLQTDPAFHYIETSTIVSFPPNIGILSHMKHDYGIDNRSMEGSSCENILSYR